MIHASTQGRSLHHGRLDLYPTGDSKATDRRHCGARMFFADYSKGFDLIDHSILLRELAFFHIDTVLILNGRWQAVRIGNSLSERKSPRGDETACDFVCCDDQQSFA